MYVMDSLYGTVLNGISENFLLLRRITIKISQNIQLKKRAMLLHQMSLSVGDHHVVLHLAAR